MVETIHHVDQPSSSGSEISLQTHNIPDAAFAVKLRLGAILSERWILALHKTIQAGMLEVGFTVGSWALKVGLLTILLCTFPHSA